MPCPDCGRAMVPNFTFNHCEWCETKDISDLTTYPGFIVYDEDRPDAPYYVFRYPREARKWRDAKGLDRMRLKKVLSPAPFNWHALKKAGRPVVIARRLYSVAPDHRFPPDQRSVFFPPKRRKE